MIFLPRLTLACAPVAHRCCARDAIDPARAIAPAFAPAIDRYDADSFLESESEPPTRARTRNPLARRARESHTHTHHRRATSRSRPNDSRLATRASTSPVPIARVHHVGTRLVSPHHTHRSRVDFSTTTTLVHHRSITHTTHTRPASARTHEDTSTDHDSSSVIHTSTRTRSPPWKIQKSIRGRAVDPPRRARARSSSTASSSRVVRARGWVKKRKRDA